MSFTVTLLPANRSFTVMRDEPILSAAIRQGIGMPYGCRDGACASCKSRLLEGRVIHGAHQLKALSVAEEDAGYILPCCAAAQTDCVIQARSVPGAGEFPILKMPARVLERKRAAADVMILRLQLPANQNLQYRAGQYIEVHPARRRPTQLLDGQRAAQPGHTAGARTAPAPHRRRSFHRPCVPAHARTRRSCAWRARSAASSCVRTATSRSCCSPAVTGFAPIKALIEHMEHRGIERPATLYWGCRALRDLYLHDWALAAERRLPRLRYVPVLSHSRPDDDWRGRIGLVHEAVMADLPDLSAYQVYACGVPAMVDAARADFQARCALPADEFYADAFTSEADKHGA